MRIVYHHRTRSTDAQRIHIQEIVRAFESLGHEVEVVSLVPTGEEQHNAARDAGEPAWRRWVRRIPCLYELIQLGYNAIGIAMLLKAVVKKRPGFIYERYSLFNFTGVFVARCCNIPIVLEVNSPFALELSRDREIRLHRFSQWTERVICNLADKVLVVSTPLARILRNAGVDDSRLVLMPNGVRPSAFRAGAASHALRNRLGLAGCTVIGFAGWFRKWHGLEMLLESFRDSRLAERGVKVLLIGDGPSMPDLKAFAASHRLADSIVFSGPLPHAEVPGYLDLIDIAVQPQANEYCCPMKILEYMSLGKPVVAPRQENILDLLRDGEYARLFEPDNPASLAEALTELVRDRERTAAMGRRAKAAIGERGFLWTANASRVLDLVRPSNVPKPVPAGRGHSAAIPDTE